MPPSRASRFPTTVRTPLDCWQRSNRAWRKSWQAAKAEGEVMADRHVGFDEMSKYPLFEALHNRRSRRISLGIQSIPAGSNSFTSNAKPQPLSALEEAVLISAVGMTGITLPDRPFQSPTGQNILGTPNINFPGRAAGSTDNAQGTYFFLINDTGAYLLQRVEPKDPNEP